MPSIIDGLFSARAGIASHGTAIATLSDNISNANTTGFKASRADFADLLAGNLSGASVGSGSQVVSTTQILNQGTLEFTGRGLDVAIDGNGFFMVSDIAGGGQTYYSRAGNLKIDPAGNLLNQNGYQLLGFPVGGAGGLEALNVNERSSNSIQTNAVTIGGNLSADAGITAAAAIPVLGSTFNTYNTAAQFSTFVDVFDSLGGQHTVTNYFYHTAPNAWTVVAVVDGADTGSVNPTDELGRVNLTFGNDGLRPAATIPVPPLGDINAVPTWANGSSTTSPLTFTFDPFTQFSSPSAVTSITQDGTGGGAVIGFTVEANGNLFAQLDNGQTATIGTLALASFSNNEGLRRIGGSLYAESTDSGEPVVGRPNTGTLGALEAGALELSTSDTAGDFIKLISLQRGFQGSARVITSINDLLNEIINLA